MADNLGPNLYQGGIAGGGAPEVNRYDQQVETEGELQPANAQGQRIISGFGAAAPSLAKGVDDFDIAAALWLEQQKSAAQLYGHQALQQAAATAQPGQRIAPVVNKGFRQFSDSLVRAAVSPQMKASLSSDLDHIGDRLEVQGTLLDDQKAVNDAASYFEKTLGNKEQVYATLPYDQIDGQLYNDLGGINSRLKRIPLEPETRAQMQEMLMQRLSEAANTRKIRLDPDRYLAKDAVDNPPPSSEDDSSLDETDGAPPRGSLSYNIGTSNQKRQWRQDAALSRDARNAEAEQARQQQAAAYQQAQRDAANAVADKYAAGHLTADDVLNSGLPPDAQRQAIAMMARDPSSPGNPALHRRLAMQAASGNLSDRSELLPYLARHDGINPRQAANTAFAMRLAGEPHGIRLLKDLEGPILGNRDGITDPDGPLQYSNMLFRLQQYAEAADKRGLSLESIIDPSSKYYVGASLMRSYARSPSEKLDAQVERARQVRAAIGDEDARLPGETFPDYVARRRSSRR